MVSIKCAVCGRGDVDLFRMNATGQKGLWACNEHKDQFDGRVPDEVKAIVDALKDAP